MCQFKSYEQNFGIKIMLLILVNMSKKYGIN